MLFNPLTSFIKRGINFLFRDEEEEETFEFNRKNNQLKPINPKTFKSKTLGYRPYKSEAVETTAQFFGVGERESPFRAAARGAGGSIVSIKQTAGQLMTEAGETDLLGRLIAPFDIGTFGERYEKARDGELKNLDNAYWTAPKESKERDRFNKAIADVGKKWVESNKAWIKEKNLDPQKGEDMLIYDLGAGAGSLIEAVVLTALTGDPTIASISFGLKTKGAVYEEAREFEKTPEEASLISTGAGITEAVLEKFGLNRFMNPATKGIVSTMTSRFITEAVQEGLQGLGTNVWTRIGYNDKQNLMEGVTRSVLIGGFIGGGASIAMSPFESRGIDSQPEQNGLTMVETNHLNKIIIPKITTEIRNGVENAYKKMEKYTEKHPMGMTLEDVSKDKKEPSKMEGMIKPEEIVEPEMIEPISKLHPEDAKKMEEFIDYVRLEKEENIDLEVSARELAEHYGIEEPKTKGTLANKFERVLYEKEKRTKVPVEDVKYKKEAERKVKFETPVKEANKILGKFFNEKEVEFMTFDSRVPHLPGGKFTPGKIYGRSYKNMIDVVERNGKVSEEVVYHESFHQYFDRFVSKERRGNLTKLMIEKRDIKATENQSAELVAEEMMADEFADWLRTGKTFSEKLASFFRTIVYQLKKWSGKESQVQKLFDDMVAGKREVAEGKEISPKYKKEVEQKKIENIYAIEAEKAEFAKKKEKEIKTIESKEFDTISEEIREQVNPFFRPSRERTSRAFSLIGNKDTTVPLFSDLFEDWIKKGTEVIVEPYAGAYTLGTHSMEKAINAGLKEFHSNIFDNEKYIIVDAIKQGKIKEVEMGVVRAVKTLDERIFENARKELDVLKVLKVLKDFKSKNSKSFIGSGKWLDYIRKKKVGKEVLLYKDVYEKYRKVFQEAFNDIAKTEVSNLDTAVLNSLYKRIGIFGGKGQSLLRVGGFTTIETNIFGKYGMMHGFKDIENSFNIAKKAGTKIKLYNEDGINFIKRFNKNSEKIGFYFDPPYVKTAGKAYKETGIEQLNRFSSGKKFYEKHKNVFEMVVKGSKIALTNDVDQEYISTLLPKIKNAKLFAYREGNTPTSLIVSEETEGVVNDFVGKAEKGESFKAYKWSNQEHLAKVIRRGGYTEKTIEFLKKHNVSDDVINSLKIDGTHLKDLVKVKREANGEISTTISKEALDYIKSTSKIKNLDKKWIKKHSFGAIKKEVAGIFQGYETGARFFHRIGEGFKTLLFDPIRAGERLAAKREKKLKTNELKPVFDLNKRQAKQLWAYTAKKQGKDVKAPEYNKLNKKVKKAYIAVIRTTEKLYPTVKKITIKRGREIGEIKNYSPLYTKDDIKLVDEGGFNFTRKDPFFGSTKERVEGVPTKFYEKDYRKVMDSWIAGVSKYIDVGERTVAVKYLLDSKELQEIAGKETTNKLLEWYNYIVSPPKVEGLNKGMRIVRTTQALSILGFKYSVPIKQFLNIFDLYTMTSAKSLMKAGTKVFGHSPVAELARNSGSVQERSVGLAVQDLKSTLVNWGSKPTLYTDKLTARIGRIALVDQMLIRNKKAGIKLSPKEFKNMERRADDCVDAVMGAMSSAETPAYFRSEIGKNVNQFYSQLNAKMQHYLTDIFKDEKYAKMAGGKKKLLAKSLVSVLLAGYLEKAISDLYFADEPDDIAKGILESLAGNLPIVGSIMFALKTGQPYSPSPVLGNITKLLIAIAEGKTDKALWAASGFLGFPVQLKNVITGSEVVSKKGVYSKKGKLLFPVEETSEQARTLLKGKWGSRAAQEYFEPEEDKEEAKTPAEKRRMEMKERLEKSREESESGKRRREMKERLEKSRKNKL